MREKMIPNKVAQFANHVSGREDNKRFRRLERERLCNLINQRIASESMVALRAYHEHMKEFICKVLDEELSNI